jgi:2-keto-3-deoxy-L-rhamnonate aldolase RhmA
VRRHIQVERSTGLSGTVFKHGGHYADEYTQAEAAGREARIRRHDHLSRRAVVEMLGYMGFDWVLIDNEHGSFTSTTRRT